MVAVEELRLFLCLEVNVTIELNLIKASEAQARQRLDDAVVALDEIGVTVWATPAQALIMLRFDRRHNGRELEWDNALVLRAQETRCGA